MGTSHSAQYSSKSLKKNIEKAREFFNQHYEKNNDNIANLQTFYLIYKGYELPRYLSFYILDYHFVLYQNSLCLCHQDYYKVIEFGKKLSFGKITLAFNIPHLMFYENSEMIEKIEIFPPHPRIEGKLTFETLKNLKELKVEILKKTMNLITLYRILSTKWSWSVNDYIKKYQKDPNAFPAIPEIKILENLKIFQLTKVGNKSFLMMDSDNFYLASKRLGLKKITLHHFDPRICIYQLEEKIFVFDRVYKVLDIFNFESSKGETQRMVAFSDTRKLVDEKYLYTLNSEFLNVQLEGEGEIYIPFPEAEFNVDNSKMMDYLGANYDSKFLFHHLYQKK